MTKIQSKINKIQKKINPRIAKDIENLIKPYWELIGKSSDYYKLRTLAIDIDKLNIQVKKDVENLLLMFKIAARQKIEEKLKKFHESGKNNKYNITHIRKFIESHKIDSDYYSVLYNSIYGKMMVNLGLEDFKVITWCAKKATFYSLDVGNMQSPEINKMMKIMTRKTNNAILIMTGNKETTLDELDFIWTNVLKYLPKHGKTAFAYKIDDVDKLQLDLLAVG